MGEGYVKLARHVSVDEEVVLKELTAAMNDTTVNITPTLSHCLSISLLLFRAEQLENLR